MIEVKFLMPSLQAYYRLTTGFIMSRAQANSPLEGEGCLLAPDSKTFFL